MTHFLTHSILGDVTVEQRRNARNITARWRGDRVHVIAPHGISVSSLSDALGRMAPRLTASRPDTGSMYYEGRVMEFDGLRITIGRQSALPETVIARPRRPETVINVGTALDFDNPDTAVTIRKVIDNVATALAPDMILDRAKAIASTLGLQPIVWAIGRGKRTLGTCSTRGVITLSSHLVFYPRQLRDYVVCHELAHLCEMNHSKAFHEVCDRYCMAILSTPEVVAEASLRDYTRRLSRII